MAYDQNTTLIKVTALCDTALAQLSNLWYSAAMAQYKLVMASTPDATGTPSIIPVTSHVSRPFGVLYNNPRVHFGPTGNVIGIDEAEVVQIGNVKCVLGGAPVTLTPSAVGPVTLTVPSTTGFTPTGAVTGTGVATTITAVVDATHVTVASGSGITLSTSLTFAATPTNVVATPTNIGSGLLTVTSVDTLSVGSIINGTGVATVVTAINSGTTFTVASTAGIVAGTTVLTCGASGGVVTSGDAVGVDDQGGIVTVVPGVNTDQYILGTALGSGTTGDVIPVSLDVVSAKRAA